MNFRRHTPLHHFISFRLLKINVQLLELQRLPHMSGIFVRCRWIHLVQIILWDFVVHGQRIVERLLLLERLIHHRVIFLFNLVHLTGVEVRRQLRRSSVRQPLLGGLLRFWILQVASGLVD